MPYRDDFEKDYRNDAEAIVSKLLLAPDDDQLDKGSEDAMWIQQTQLLQTSK